MAAQLVLENVNAITFFMAYGLAITATSLIGAQLGKDNIAEAKRIARVMTIISIIFSLITLTLVYTLRHYYIHLYTSDAKT